MAFEDFRLRVFIAAARENSFTGAARLLGISQPAVSQNISELEKELGTRFFVRSRSKAILTDEGRLFLNYAEQIMMLYSAAAAAFPGTGYSSEKLFRIGVSPELNDFIILPYGMEDNDVDIRPDGEGNLLITVPRPQK